MTTDPASFEDQHVSAVCWIAEQLYPTCPPAAPFASPPCSPPPSSPLPFPPLTPSIGAADAFTDAVIKAPASADEDVLDRWLDHMVAAVSD